MKYALWIAQVLLALAFVSCRGDEVGHARRDADRVVPVPRAVHPLHRGLRVARRRRADPAGLLRVREELTPLAAAGLASIMTGAVATTLAVGGGTAAAMPLALGLLATFVAYGRTRPARRSSEEAPQSAVVPAAS